MYILMHSKVVRWFRKVVRIGGGLGFLPGREVCIDECVNSACRSLYDIITQRMVCAAKLSIM